MESFLFFIVIALLSAGSQWLQKRRAGGEVSWEEVTGENSKTEKPQPSTVQTTTRNTSSSPPPIVQRKQVEQPIPSKLSKWEEEIRRMLGDPSMQPQQPPRHQVVEVPEAIVVQPEVTPEGKTSEIKIAAAKGGTVLKTPKKKGMGRKNRRPTNRIKTFLQDRNTVKNLILASVILGQPKSMENERSLTPYSPPKL
jgi:hypothetical protein